MQRDRIPHRRERDILIELDPLLSVFRNSKFEFEIELQFPAHN
jgi:hypothetical protein